MMVGLGATGLISRIMFAWETSDMDILVSLDCHVEAGKLFVRYALTNNGRLPLLTYDGAPGKPPDAEWPDLKGQLYVSVLGDKVSLKRIDAPPPPGVLVNRRFIPPLSQTLPGEQREVRFVLEEPVTERSEFTPDFAGATYVEQTVHYVELQLGCFWRTQAMELIPFPANPKAFRLKGTHGAQSFLTTQKQCAVRVKQRTDPAFRRI
jgi:hypothetical protein